MLSLRTPRRRGTWARIAPSPWEGGRLGPGYTVFLTPTEAVLSLGRPPLIKAQSSEKSVIPGKAAGRDPESWDIQAQRDWMPASAGMTRAASRDHRDQDTQPRSVLRMQLAGANPKPQISGADALPGKVDYLRGNDSKKWRTNVSTYAKPMGRMF